MHRLMLDSSKCVFEKSIQLNSSILRQKGLYHSQAGVYGHKPKTERNFKVDKPTLESRANQSSFYRLVMAYRQHGHRIANINPVSLSKTNDTAELDVDMYGLDTNNRYKFTGLINTEKSEGTLAEAVKFLQDVYCNTISAEFTHLQDLEEREWFSDRFESLHRDKISLDKKKEVLREMLKSQALDKFLASKFVTLKRYGGEGAESMMAFFLEAFHLAASDGVKQIVMGVHHRGRLNLLTGLLQMPPELLFRKLQGKSEFPDEINSLGDVISHLCSSAELDIEGNKLNVLTSNLPSHLEAVCPVSMGKTRSLQQQRMEAQYGLDPKSNWGDTIMNIQVHGDAALMGQGISQESLLLSLLPHFYTGGIVHLIVNNQLGFTTPPPYGRGTTYASDVAKIISAPVIHVNGDYPEDVLRATRIAMEYQRKFRKNVFVDLNCYRKWGHNELDDPTFTNPLLYSVINEKRTVPDMYVDTLRKEGVITENEATDIEQNHFSYLNQCLKNVDSFVPSANHLDGEWKDYIQAPNAITLWNTGVDLPLLQLVGAKSVSYPETFNIHPHLIKSHIKGRLSKLREGTHLDWATAETLAFGSLLYEGYHVRISGQDVGRGTFSHRHAMLVDQKSNDIYIPLNNISPKQTGQIELANSLLSEEAVLGFEYGMSTGSPKTLTIWEAQFGDFFNGAQIQIDTYVTSGECKWLSLSGLVLLLPHGYDGAGPEHSSCRMERFLQLSDSSETYPDGEDVNIHIVNPTTPAQYFHVLRRQMVRNYRKPLIVVAPKILLRSPDATSSLDELAPNTSFQPLIGDSNITDNNMIQKIIFVSGKHFYALRKYREEIQAKDVAIIRLEELCPFPTHHLRQEIAKYRNAKDFIWSQEEPQNMGAWTYCKSRFENLVGHKVRFTGRQPLGAPAVGIGEQHRREAEFVIRAPFEPYKKN